MPRVKNEQFSTDSSLIECIKVNKYRKEKEFKLPSKIVRSARNVYLTKSITLGLLILRELSVQKSIDNDICSCSSGLTNGTLRRLRRMGLYLPLCHKDPKTTRSSKWGVSIAILMFTRVHSSLHKVVIITFSGESLRLLSSIFWTTW